MRFKDLFTTNIAIAPMESIAAHFADTHDFQIKRVFFLFEEIKLHAENYSNNSNCDGNN